MATNEMTHRERIQAALADAETDRVPISLWWHIPEDPHRAADLAAEAIRIQREYGWDFVKMMPSGAYIPESLGCKVTEEIGPDAVVSACESPFKTPDALAKVPAPDPTSGMLAEQVEAVRLVRQALGPDVPILASVFSPFSVVRKLAMHLAMADLLGKDRPKLEAALRTLTDGIKRLSVAFLDAGADGLYYAVQDAHQGGLSREDFVALAKPRDLEVLAATQGKATFNLLHVCRTNIYPDLVADYPVPAISWESVGLRPTLAEARQVWPGKALVGGLNKNGVLRFGTPAQTAAEVRSVIEAAGPRRLVVAAGCVVRIATPPENMRAAKQATSISQA